MDKNVILTIEPGVTVDFGEYYLQVNGTLCARGTSNSKITFTTTVPVDNWVKPQINFTSFSRGWNDNLNSGCIIENANLNIVTINVDGSSPKLISNSFSYSRADAISVTSGSPMIALSYFDNTTHGVSIFGSATFSNNVIINYGFDWGISCGGSATVSYNKVKYCYGGISASDQANVFGNAVVDNKFYGISSVSKDVSIQFNYVRNDTDGVMGCGKISYNTIIGNSVAIQSPNAAVNYNNIYGNSQSSIRLSNGNSVDATSNYWGTNDTQTIEASIHDSKDDFSLGTVTYQPILTSPVPQAPVSEDISDLPLPPAETPPLIQTATPPNGIQNQQPQGTSDSPTHPSVENPSASGSGFEYASVVIVLVVTVGVVVVVLAVVAFDRRIKRSA